MDILNKWIGTAQVDSRTVNPSDSSYVIAGLRDTGDMTVQGKSKFMSDASFVGSVITNSITSYNGTTPVVFVAPVQMLSDSTASSKFTISKTLTTNDATVNTTLRSLSTIIADSRIGIGTTNPVDRFVLSIFDSTVRAVVSNTNPNGAAMIDIGTGPDIQLAHYESGPHYSSLMNVDNVPFIIGTNNIERIRFTEYNPPVNYGYIGIGTTQATSQLDIYGASPINNNSGQLELHGLEDTGAADRGAGILFEGHSGSSECSWGCIQILKENSAIGNWNAYARISVRNNPLGVVERFRITSAGNVGIGTTAINSKLHVYDSAATKIRIQRNNTGTNMEIGSYDFASGATDIARARIVSYTPSPDDSGAIAFETKRPSGSLTEAVRITDLQYVGIATTSPQAKLHVNGGSATYALMVEGDNVSAPAKIALRRINTSNPASATGNIDWICNTGLIGARIGVNDDYGGSMQFKLGTGDATSTRMIIASSGYVGVGTTNPTNRLSVYDRTVDSDQVSLKVDQEYTHTSGTHYPIALYVAKHKHNVAIGTTQTGYDSGILIENTINDSNFYGTIQNQYGAYIRHGIYATAGSGARTVQNSIGLFLEAYEFSGTINSNYGIYQVGSSAVKNYFTGSIGIGTSNPGYKLDVYYNGTGSALNVFSNAVGSRNDTGIDFSVSNVGRQLMSRIGLQATTASIGAETGGLTFWTINNGSLTEKMFIRGDGNVGIGTTNPNKKLHIGTNSDDGIRLGYSDSASIDIYRQQSTGYYRLNVNETGSDLYLTTQNRNVVVNSSMVGIGTTTPIRPLQVDQGGTAGPLVRLVSGNSNTSIEFIPSVSSGRYNWLIGAQQNVSDGFEITPSTSVNGTTFSNPLLLMQAGGGGRVGVGISQPQATFHVKGPGGYTVIIGKYDTPSGLFFQSDAGPAHYNWRITTQTVVHKGFEIASSDVPGSTTWNNPILVAIADSSNVGICQVSPSSRLHVQAPNHTGYSSSSQPTSDVLVDVGGSSDAYTSLALASRSPSNSDVSVVAITNVPTGNGSSDMAFGTRSSYTFGERVRITKDGNIGAGTVNPAAYDPSACSLVISRGGANAGISIITDSNKNGNIFFGRGTGSLAYMGSITYDHFNEKLYFGAAGATQLTMTASGVNLGIGTTVNEFSTDGSLSGNSDTALPTEKAVKTYVDSATGGGSVWTRSAPYVYLANSGDYLGVGTNTPVEKLGVNGNAFISGNILGTDAVSQIGGPSNRYNALWLNSGIDFKNNLSFNYNNTGNTYMTITTAGKVGVGTTTPGEQFEVVGNIKALIDGNKKVILERVDGTPPTFRLNSSYASSLYAPLIFGQTNNSGTFQPRITIAGGTGTAGNVGIGVDSPGEKLEVAGNVKVMIDDNQKMILERVAGTPPQFRINSSYASSLYAPLIFGQTNNSGIFQPIIYIEGGSSQNGNIGIRVTDPQMTTEWTNNSIIGFRDNGTIRSQDQYHQILFRRSENKIEVREYGSVILSAGATSGTETATVSVDPSLVTSKTDIKFSAGSNNYGYLSRSGNEIDFTGYYVSGYPQINFRQQSGATNKIRCRIDEFGNFRVIYDGDSLKFGQLAWDYPNFMIRTETNASGKVPIQFTQQDSGGSVVAGVFDASQQLGINTASPTSQVHVYKSSGDVFFKATSGENEAYFGMQSDGHAKLANGNAGGKLYFQTGGANRMFLDTSGYLGINTSSPGTYLEVASASSGGLQAMFGSNSPSNYRGYIYFSEVNTINAGYYVNATAELWLNYRGYANGNTQYRNLSIGNGTSNGIAIFRGSDANVGFGTMNPTSQVHTYRSSGDVFFKSTSGGNEAYFGMQSDGHAKLANGNAGGNLYLQAGGSVRFTISNNGNAGFQVAPDGTYTVKVASSGIVGGDGNITFGGGGTTYLRGSGGNRAYVDSSGITMSSGTFNGNLSGNASTASSASVASVARQVTSTDGNVYLQNTTGTKLWLVDTDSNLYTNKLWCHDTAGGGWAEIWGYLYDVSDERLKNNVIQIKDGLAIVNSLRGVEFDWKNDNKHSSGFIAQEVEPIIPHAVNTEVHKVGDQQMEDLKGVKYNNITPYLVEAIKELSGMVDQLKARIAVLEGQK